MEYSDSKEYISTQELGKDEHGNLIIRSGESIKIPVGEMNGAFRIGRKPNTENFRKENFVDSPSFSLKDEDGNNIPELQRVGLLIQPINTGGMYVKNETKNETREIILNGKAVKINSGESVFVDGRDNAPGFDYDLGDGKHIAHIERGPLSNSVELSVTSNKNSLKDIGKERITPSPQSVVELSRLRDKIGDIKEMPDEQWISIPENLPGGGIAIGVSLDTDQSYSPHAGARLDIDGKANSPIGIYYDTTKDGFLITNPTDRQMTIWADGEPVKIDPSRSPTRIHAKLVTFSYADKYVFMKKEGGRTLLKSVDADDNENAPSRIVNSPIKNDVKPINQGVDTSLEKDRAIPGFIVLDGELYTKNGNKIEVNGKTTTYDKGKPTRVQSGDKVRGSDGNLYKVGTKRNKRTQNERWVFRPVKD